MNSDIGTTFGETALTGSLLVALPVAVLAGLVSFLSPCVLPLVPGYLGYVTGLSAQEIESTDRPVAAGTTSTATRERVRTGNRLRLFAGVGLFILGFTAVFVSFGALFGGLGSTLLEQADWIYGVMGVVMIVMGLIFAGWLPGSARTWSVSASPSVGLAGAPLLGATFGIGWTPCIGPTLAAVQALAFTEATAGRGALLSVAYCLGLGMPFVAVALAYRRSMRAFSWFSKHQLAVKRVGGALLIVVGLLLLTGAWSELVARMQGWVSGFEVVV